MDPESETGTVRRNTLVEMLRAYLFEGAESLLEKAGGQQVIKDALTGIKADTGSTNRVLAWIAACIDKLLLDREKETVTRVKDKVRPVVTILNTISSEITSLEAEAKMLLASSAATTLRVTGTTRVTSTV